MFDAQLQQKVERLQQRLRELGSVIVAFSGGVDSAVLLLVAVRTLGREEVLAVTGRSPSVPAAELEGAARLAAEVGARHEYHDTAEFADENYTSNPKNRCYFCKNELYGRLDDLAQARGFSAVISGANLDDADDYRPGQQAAQERRVRAPLAEAGITKADLRAIGAGLGLSIHDKPASPCLSSRIPYGQAVTPAKLRQVDLGETFLRELGFRVCRVRHHGDVARVEVPAEEMARLMDGATRMEIDRYLRGLGFQYVTVDLRGFRSGSLNDVHLGAGLRSVVR